MKLSTLFTITAVFFVLTGLASVLAPGTLISLYGGEADELEKYTLRFQGGLSLGFAVLAWLARNAEESEARHAIVLALFITFAICFSIAIVGTLSGVLPAIEWPFILLFLLLALGYGYFQFVKPSAS